MSDIPEIQRQYRINIIPAGSAEPVNPIDLGRRTKFGGSPDEIQPRGQSGIVVRAAAAGGVSLAKSIRLVQMGRTIPTARITAPNSFALPTKDLCPVLLGLTGAARDQGPLLMQVLPENVREARATACD
jgi:hypothetical protein